MFRPGNNHRPISKRRLSWLGSFRDGRQSWTTLDSFVTRMDCESQGYFDSDSQGLVADDEGSPCHVDNLGSEGVDGVERLDAC